MFNSLVTGQFLHCKDQKGHRIVRRSHNSLGGGGSCNIRVISHSLKTCFMTNSREYVVLYDSEVFVCVCLISICGRMSVSQRAPVIFCFIHHTVMHRHARRWSLQWISLLRSVIKLLQRRIFCNKSCCIYLVEEREREREMCAILEII